MPAVGTKPPRTAMSEEETLGKQWANAMRIFWVPNLNRQRKLIMSHPFFIGWISDLINYLFERFNTGVSVGYSERLF